MSKIPDIELPFGILSLVINKEKRKSNMECNKYGN